MRSLVALVLLGLPLAACEGRQPAPDPQAQAAGVPAKGIDRRHAGKPAPDVAFNDPDGGEISLADFHGTPILVNLWATWCAPCVKELPTLDRLTELHEHDGTLGIVTISQDAAPQASVIAFITKLGLTRISGFHDPKMALSAAAGVDVLPTSILYDAKGREVWRYVGDLDWTGKEAARLLAEASGGTS